MCMKSIWNFKWIMGALAALIISSVHILAEAQSERPAVLALSMTLQGNGLNWPSTTGAVSEMLYSAALEAREIRAKDGRPVRIDVTSIAGSSSGAVTAILIDAIMRNPTVVSQTGAAGKREITIEEAERAAAMMRFISLSLDLSTKEAAGLISGAAYQQAKALAQRVAAVLAKASSLFKMFAKIENPVWVPLLARQDAISDFGRYIYFARTADFQMINQRISNFRGLENMVRMAAQDHDLAPLVANLNFIYDIPQIETEILRDHATDDNWFLRSAVGMLRVGWLTKYTNYRRRILKAIINDSALHVSQKSAREILQDAKDMTPASVNPANIDNPFSKIYGEQLNTGFMTLSMFQEFASEDVFANTILKTGKIDYESLRPYVFMDRATAEELTSSSAYRESLKDPSLRLERYVIVAVENAYSAMNPSIIEPGLLSELKGKLTDRKFGISAIYDPRLDKSKSYKLIPAEDERLKDRRLFAVGGFPTAPIIAQLQALLHLTRISALEKAGHVVYGRAHIYATHVKWLTDSMFATQLLRKRLNTGDDARGLAQIADWFKWMRIFYDREVPLMSTGRNAVIETWTNWELSPIPGAVTGISDILVAKAINDVREAWRHVASHFLPDSSLAVVAHDRSPRKGSPPKGWSPRPPIRCEDIFARAQSAQ